MRLYFRAWPASKRVAKVLPHTIIVMYTATATTTTTTRSLYNNNNCCCLPARMIEKIKINFTVIKNSVETSCITIILIYTGILLNTTENLVSP